MRSTKEFFPLLESLRAVACFSVIFFHGITEWYCREHNLYFPFFRGYLGVDLFFVLSGFVISNVLFTEFFTKGRISVRQFYFRRVLRLYPPIIVAIIIFIIPLAFFRPQEAFSNLFFVVTYTSDAVLLFRHFFPYLEYPMYFSHCWSLAIEEQFYLFFPWVFILFLGAWLKRKIRLANAFLIFNVVFVLVILVGAELLKAHFYKFFLWRFLEIFMGVFLALFLKSERLNLNSEQSSPLMKVTSTFLSSNIVLYLSLAVIILSAFYPGFNLPYYLTSYVFALACGLLIYRSAKADNVVLQKLLSGKRLRYFGKISYGMYLYHVPLFYSGVYFNLQLPGQLYQCLIIDALRTGVVIFLAAISYKFIEKPLLQFRRQPANEQVPSLQLS